MSRPAASGRCWRRPDGGTATNGPRPTVGGGGGTAGVAAAAAAAARNRPYRGDVLRPDGAGGRASAAVASKPAAATGPDDRG